MKKILLAFLCLLMAFTAGGQDIWQSRLLSVSGDGSLTYHKDGNGFVIPDFSHAGYGGGGVDLPRPAVVKEITPVGGDNTAHIQAAIDEVGAMPVGKDGMRGVLLLGKGFYPVSGTLRLRHDGVVLRGEGNGDDPFSSTVIYATGDTPHQRPVIVVGGGSNYRLDRGISDKQYISSPRVDVGAYSFDVADAGAYKPGDRIVVYHPCTEKWLQAIDYGGSPTGRWDVGSYPIVFHRRVTAVEGKRITVDAPFYYTFDRSLSDSFIYKFDASPLRGNIGVENLRVDVETRWGEDENHAWEAVSFNTAEDCWARDVVALHFGYAGFVTRSASRITVLNCRAMDPVAVTTGARKYNFCFHMYSQQVLFKDCLAVNGRHNYISNGTAAVVGCVVSNCISEGTISTDEGHRSWSVGLLFDRVSFRNPRTKTVLGLYNRGRWGLNHGWASAQSFAWNCDASGTPGTRIVIQQPPTSQNYAVGCRASFVDNKGPFAGETGYVEGTDRDGLYPASLYDAQLKARKLQAK